MVIVVLACSVAGGLAGGSARASASTASTTSVACSASQSPSSSSTPTSTAPANDWTTVDSDGDTLPDQLELQIGTDPKVADTDHDGLSDADEVVTTTDPTKPDTDGDGIADPQDDLDGDGVNNADELAMRTQAYNPDTDGDRLNDGQERSLRSNPLAVDTDSDSLSDGDEVDLGSNPLSADSDSDGTPDGQESFKRTVTSSALHASFTATGLAKSVLATGLEPAQSADLQAVPGSISPAVEVHVPETVTGGQLSLEFDPAAVSNGADLAILHFNVSTSTFDRPQDQTIDLPHGVATVRTNTFSPFIVVDIREFEKVWQNEIVLPREGNGTPIPIDSSLAIDSSGSMVDNDPTNLRLEASKLFVDALLPGDRVAVVDFDSVATVLQTLTEDRTAVKRAIDSIDASGGTDIGAGLSVALDQLPADAGRGHVAILLTDGLGPYNPDLTRRAHDAGIVVYTVGLGSGVDTALLQGIADGTGGKFFLVQDASGLKDAFERIGDDVGKPDTDGDGIADETEISGWRNGRGVVFKTDPAKADTDNDGLSDGEEAGALKDGAPFGKGTYYSGMSDPTKPDTDNDGLADLDEVQQGTSVFSADTDADGLNDLDELEIGFDPTQHNADGDSFYDRAERDNGTDPFSYDLSSADNAGAFIGGAIFGDWEWGARNVGRLSSEQMDSVAYLAGTLASGLVAIGDIRDLIANIGRGEWGDAFWSLVGVLPLVGDAAKVTTKLVKFASKSKRAGRSALQFAGRELDQASARKAVRAMVTKDPAGARLTQDLQIRGRKAVAANSGRNADGSLAKIGKDPAQAARLQELIDEARRAGARDIRVNQWQVDAAGNYVGRNRPDLQYILNGKVHIVELDRPLRSNSNLSKRGLQHYHRMLANDPSLDESQIRLLNVGAAE